MAILSITTFRKLFDSDRITQLASDYSELHGEPYYDEEAVTTILTQADAFVKAALSKMYSTAEIEADKFIERLTADIAMYYLEFRRNEISATVQEAFKRAQLFLEGLRDGSFKLGAVSQLLPNGETTQPIETIETGFFKLTENEEALLG